MILELTILAMAAVGVAYFVVGLLCWLVCMAAPCWVYNWVYRHNHPSFHRLDREIQVSLLSGYHLHASPRSILDWPAWLPDYIREFRAARRGLRR